MERNIRVKYHNCPLVEVVLQVNFPTILSIETELPSKFQERVRTDFPNYISSTEEEGVLSLGVNQSGIQPLVQKRSSNIVHNFISTDGKRKICFSKNRFFISTLEYNTWEKLKEIYDNSFREFVDIYQPSIINRIGLRYIDVFDKVKLNVQDIQWNELLEDFILGCLNQNVTQEAKVVSNSVQSDIIFKGVNIHIEAGLVLKDNHILDDNNNSFLLNCDYYKSENYDLSMVDSISNKLHDASFSFFSKSIKIKLHKAMDPEDIN